MIEKPSIKNNECRAVIFLMLKEPGAFMSSKDRPVIYVIYEGKRGRMQGERKDNTPAEKDIMIETSLVVAIISPWYDLTFT